MDKIKANIYYKTISILSVLNKKLVTTVMFNHNMGYKLNLNNPKTLNEKIQWLKLNEFDELTTQCADKLLVRQYVEKLELKDILADLIGVYKDSSEIDFDSLPDKYVLKCNHGAGYNILVVDKNQVDENECKKKLNRWLKEDYWRKAAEFQYKNIDKMIICEKFIEEFQDKAPLDYKIHCFNGEPKVILVCSDRDGINHPKYAYYDLNWNKLNYSVMFNGEDDIDYPKPKHFDEMIEISRKLAKPFKFVRVDLYDTDSKIFFGELTFTPAGGIDTDLPYKADLEMGNMIEL